MATMRFLFIVTLMTVNDTAMSVSMDVNTN